MDPNFELRGNTPAERQGLRYVESREPKVPDQGFESSQTDGSKTQDQETQRSGVGMITRLRVGENPSPTNAALRLRTVKSPGSAVRRPPGLRVTQTRDR